MIFFFSLRTQISHHFLFKTLHSVPAHKHKLKANRHSPQTSATCLIPAKVSPSLSGFLVSSALELALIPADWHSGSLVCALLSTQCPRKAFPVLRSIGDRGRGLQRVAPGALNSPPECLPRSIKTLSAPQFPHLQTAHEPLSLGAVKAGGQGGRVGDRGAPGTLWDPGQARRPIWGHSGHLVIPEQRCPRTSPRPHSWDRLHPERGAPPPLRRRGPSRACVELRAEVRRRAPRGVGARSYPRRTRGSAPTQHGPRARARRHRYRRGPDRRAPGVRVGESAAASAGAAPLPSVRLSLARSAAAGECGSRATGRGGGGAGSRRWAARAAVRASADTAPAAPRPRSSSGRPGPEG